MVLHRGTISARDEHMNGTERASLSCSRPMVPPDLDDVEERRRAPELLLPVPSIAATQSRSLL
jgi:hypothetical protein